MCGISCIVALERQTKAQRADSNRESTSKELDESLAQIRHRGPDSQGQWTSPDGRVALGHVRLEINDLSPAGAQPFSDPSNNIHAVVNGEIYDYDRLRAEMIEKENYAFKGRSDCELVLALYKYYGAPSFLSHLRGEFSFCLYDCERRVFIAARDRYGIKPLFWTVAEGRLLVAAEMKAFKAIKGFNFEWDVRNIADGSYNAAYYTTFKNVEKVRPGHYLLCKSFGTIAQLKYWDSEYPDKAVKDPRTEQDMIKGVRDRLLEAIRHRLRADVKVGVSLSGGLDSSVVAGMVNHLIKEGEKVGGDSVTERLSCFGIAFDADSGYDESSIADRTAQHLGVRFYKKHMSEQALADQFQDATWHCEQPFADLNFIGTYALSELVREEGFRVLLNGQGSDEVLAGYALFVPDFLREPDLAFAGPTVPEADRPKLQETVESTVASLTLTKPDSLPDGSQVATRQLNNLKIASMLATTTLPLELSPWVTTAHGPCDLVLPFCDTLSGTVLSKIQNKWHPLHSAEYFFLTTTLPNNLLGHLGDRGEMAHSIEGRTPFLDHHFTEYVNGLPPSMKIRQDPLDPSLFVEKYVLKQAAKPFVTDEIYKRKKHPYSAPVLYPVGGPIYRLIKGLVTEENVGALGFVEKEGVEEKVERCFKEQESVAMRSLFVLAQFVVLARLFGVEKAVPESVRGGGRW